MLRLWLQWTRSHERQKKLLPLLMGLLQLLVKKKQLSQSI
jgi:hypothetical protein